ncbi:type IV toxin-antitoxin system AbiEi family antitoxin domain-containing protein [Kribbella sp. NPDC059898]|uniref:type IV toxin-antitoxin system AbiEi family antitoxin domain-containing protein n=1 Tax=Kribbella sp. NPDC059898 TaxID=3346995 RepID=UPI00364A1F80
MQVAELAGEQWGLITTGQARQLGVSAAELARWADRGALTRLTHGVYKITGSAYDPHDDLRAAWLGLDPKRTAIDRLAQQQVDAVVSHRSAAALHGLGDLDADVLEFTVHGRRQSRRPDVRLHTRSAPIDPRSWSRVAGLPVTTIMATIVDLAAANIDGGHLAGIVRDAVATAVVDIDDLSAALAPYAHRYNATLGNGRALVERLVSEAGLPATTERASDLVRGQGTFGQVAKFIAANTDPELFRPLVSAVDSAAVDEVAKHALWDALDPETRKRFLAAIQAAASNQLRAER